ncbi:MAG: hypothetical protein AAF950_02550 [Pseudomonadota bacterium]
MIIYGLSSRGLRPERAKPIDIEDVVAWRANRLVYDSATIAEVIADEHRYGMRDIAVSRTSLPSS